MLSWIFTFLISKKSNNIKCPLEVENKIKNVQNSQIIGIEIDKMMSDLKNSDPHLHEWGQY